MLKLDAKSKTEAQGQFHEITKPPFIAAFCRAKYLVGYTVGLSRSLQGSTLNVVDAYSHINVVKTQLQDIRRKAKSEKQNAVNLDKLEKSSSDKLILHYSPYLPAASNAPQEIKLWKRH